MHVHRLRPLIRVEKEAVSLDPIFKYIRHFANIASSAESSIHFHIYFTYHYET